MTRWLLFMMAVFLTVGCAGSRQQFYNKPQSDIQYGVAADECISVEIAYIGALGRHYIFESTVENLCDESVMVDQRDYVMWIGPQEERLSIDPVAYIDQLRKEQSQIKKQKKTNTILAIVGAGLTAVSGVGAGLSVGETVAFAAEPLLYVAEENAWASRSISSVDDEISYIDQSLYRDQVIAKNQTVTKDVIFEARRVTDNVEIAVFINGQAYAVPFDRELFNL